MERIEERGPDPRGKPSAAGRRPMPDYATYSLTSMEKLRLVGEYLALDFFISALFYRAWLAFVLFLPGIVLYRRERCKDLLRQWQSRSRREFLDGMQFFCTALQAGYAVENAFREALGELRRIYSEDTFIVRELTDLNARVGMNVPVELLLKDLGERSHIDDIRNFAEVFSIARHTGGDLYAIARNTISGMQQRQETLLEIETALAGRMLEQKMMSVIPLVILGYAGLTTPETLQSVYHTGVGVIVMSICLAVYLAAFLWGRRILRTCAGGV